MAIRAAVAISRTHKFGIFTLYIKENLPINHSFTDSTMEKQIKAFWKGYVTALYDANYSYSAITEACIKGPKKKRNWLCAE